jgi:ATP-binding cassette subfamily B protein
MGKRPHKDRPPKGPKAGPKAGPKGKSPGFGRLFGYFWPYIRAHRVLLVLSFLALFVEVGLRSLEPWPLKFIFDRVLGYHKHAGHLSGMPALDRLEPGALLTVSVVALVLIGGLRALADYANTIGFARIGNRVVTEVRRQLYRHLQGQSLAFHGQERSGELVLRVISDVNMIKFVAVDALLLLVADLLILLCMLTVMFWVHWKLALVVVGTIPLFWSLTVRLRRKLRKAARKQRKRQGAMTATASEAIGAIKVVQALSLEGAFAQLFTEQNEKSLQGDLRANRLGAGVKRLVAALLAGVTALVLWYGAVLVMDAQLTPGDLLVFLAYLKTASRSVQSWARFTNVLARAGAAGERLLELLERPPDVADLPGAVPAPRFQGAVSFEGVRFGYEPGHLVLRDVDFQAAPGQYVALVGTSGAGKSTLVGLLLRLYDPLEGRVRIDGRDVREYTLASLRPQVSMVLQDSLLFATSVRDNIACAAPGATGEEVEAAARLANAHEFILALPRGYDTVLSERGVSLSQGQRQRIAIARAAVRKSSLLILDEPTTGLDQENERAVIEALERLARGRTTFLITHDLGLAARADLVLYLEGGSIVERGTHRELMQADGRYAALFRANGATGGEGRPVPARCSGPWTGVGGPP